MSKETNSRVQFPSELERRNTSRDITGRNIYDILTYEEKVNFLINHPEYTFDNLPKEFFNIREIMRIENEYPDLAKHRHEEPMNETRTKELMFKLFPHNPDTLKYVDEKLKNLHNTDYTREDFTHKTK